MSSGAPHPRQRLAASGGVEQLDHSIARGEARSRSRTDQQRAPDLPLDATLPRQAADSRAQTRGSGPAGAASEAGHERSPSGEVTAPAAPADRETRAPTPGTPCGPGAPRSGAACAPGELKAEVKPDQSTKPFPFSARLACPLYGPSAPLPFDCLPFAVSWRAGPFPRRSFQESFTVNGSSPLKTSGGLETRPGARAPRPPSAGASLSPLWPSALPSSPPLAGASGSP